MKKRKLLLEETNEHIEKYRFSSHLLSLFLALCCLSAFGSLLYFSWQAGQSGAEWFFRSL